MKTIKQLLIEASDSISMKPPSGVKSACKRGLELKDEYGGDGLTSAAVSWAKKIADGEEVSKEKAKKMHAYFARHKVDKKSDWANPPTPGYVAWLLWGGDAGQTWSEKLTKQLEDETIQEEPKWKKKGLVGSGGAAKTAERQAAKQGKKNNKAYKSAIYAKMTHKS